MKTEEIVRSLRCSSQVPGPQMDCRICPYHMEETVDGVDYAGCDCDRIAVDAADRLEELVERCARYAEEIAVLRERMRPYPESVEAIKLSMMGKAISEITEFDGLPIDRLRELAEADKDGRLVVVPPDVPEAK